jgi:hypothetical protein
MGTDDNRGMSNDFDTAAPFDGAVRLGDWGLIRARGADAASFLHSQLTQDIVKLGERQARLAGYCSAKGRLLAPSSSGAAAPKNCCWPAAPICWRPR